MSGPAPAAANERPALPTVHPTEHLRALVAAHGLEAAVTRIVSPDQVADPRLARHWAQARTLLELIRAIVSTGD